MSNIESIEIHAGRPNFEFEEVRRIEVKCEASHAFMPAPTVEEANDRLRALASRVGANAVIETKYDSGISLTSWKSLKATGLAVIKEATDKICPECAETIKRAAKKCRYCGAAQSETPVDLTSTNASELDEPAADSKDSNRSPRLSTNSQAPLRDNNNSAVWWIAGIFAFIFLLALMGL